MAGRNISASHLAMAATRVMLTCAVIGQAAGTAAGAVRCSTTTRRAASYQQHLETCSSNCSRTGPI